MGIVLVLIHVAIFCYSDIMEDKGSLQELAQLVGVIVRQGGGEQAPLGFEFAEGALNSHTGGAVGEIVVRVATRWLSVKWCQAKMKIGIRWVSQYVVQLVCDLVQQRAK